MYAGNYLLEKRLVEADAAGARKWQTITCDLARFSGQTITLRLYQRVLVEKRTAGNA